MSAKPTSERGVRGYRADSDDRGYRGAGDAGDAGTGAGLDDHVAGIQAEWERERPDLDVSPQGVFGRLHRLSALLMSEITVVYREHGLTEGEFDVLATLRRTGEPFERAPGELAQHTMVTTGAMSKRIDRLEAAGLVTRRASSEDGRGRVVALTAEGRRVIDAAFTDHIANEHRLLGGMSAADVRQLESLLAQWLARVDG